MVDGLPGAGTCCSCSCLTPGRLAAIEDDNGGGGGKHAKHDPEGGAAGKQYPVGQQYYSESYPTGQQVVAGHGTYPQQYMTGPPPQQYMPAGYGIPGTYVQ